ncbi:MAG: serine/threonine-protein kinase [Vicinamibacterales bacterium]
MSIEVGTRFGPYEIGKPLGAGGMGTVYEGVDTRLGRAVAIKVLIAQGDDADGERWLEREARAVARLSHPNICVLHDVGRHEGWFFLVMERLSGETLAQRLERGPIPLSEALAYASATAGAVDAAHRAGILHRDLKPANVMLTKSGPKLLDFGLAARHVAGTDGGATAVTESMAVSLADANAFAGTLAYMAPERLEGKPADARSDVFAFGALFYEMLAGRRAFAAASPAATVGAILSSEPAPIEGLPPAVDRVVRRCLAKDPDERWQTVRDLRETLTLIPIDAGVGAARAAFASRRWPWAAVFVVLAAAAAALGVGAWLRPGPWAPPPGLPVVVLMDSPVPERVYDSRTRLAGGTNADDITDTLRDLPVELHKETTSALWHREDEVLKQHPSLVMMHLSSFAEPTSDATSPLQPNAQERTRSFLGYVGLAERRTKFVVYSRGFAEDREREDWIADTVRRFPILKNRVQLLHVAGNDQASFRDPGTQAAVRDCVTRVLSLR